MQTSDEPFCVLVTADVYDKFADRLTGPQGMPMEWVRVNFSPRPPGFLDLLARAHCVVTRTDLTEEEYRHAPRLRLLQLPITGYDGVDLARAKRFGVVVANTGGANAVSVAEHVMLLALALYRHAIFHDRTVRDGSWINRKHDNRELFGKTFGIVGLGNVGRAVALRARGFDMRILYHDIRRPASEFEWQYGLEWRSFESLMREADVVSLHVPLTSRTRRMVDRRSLGWMKPTALLINTSRGEIVDQAALCEALQAHRLLGAGLDVFEEEPVPTDSPLLTLDNVVLAPHAGPSYESQFRMIDSVVANVVRAAQGSPPLHVVINYDDLDVATPSVG